MSALKDIAVAVLPEIAKQVGEGLREAAKDRREAAKDRRERDKPCEHGRPGGRLCSKCAKDEG